MTSLNLRFEETENYSRSAHKLCAILLGYFDPKNPTSLHSTAVSILGVLPKNKPESTEVWMFGELCIELAEQIPYHHPFQLKLVGLLEYLQLSPHLGRIFEDVDKNNTPTGHFIQYHRLGASLRDNLNGPDAENPGHYVNFHAFAANLAEYRVSGSDPTWAIWAFREGLEETCKEDGKHRQLVQDELVLAAAQWILWYGQSLFKQVIFPNEVDFDKFDKSWGPGELYHGPNGLSIERWRFWCKRFNTIASQAGEEKQGLYGKECMSVAARAAAIMESLEKSMVF